MRKADYILQKCDKFQDLISEAQEQLKLPGFEHKAPAPHVTPVEHVTAPKVAPVTLEMPKAPVPTVPAGPKFVLEPHTGGAIEPATLNDGKLNIKVDPKTGKVLAQSLPKEWFETKKSLLGDSKLELKPEFKEQYKQLIEESKVRMGMNRGMAKLQTQIDHDSEKIKETISRYYSNWKSIPSVVKWTIFTAGLMGAVFYKFTGKKATSSDPILQESANLGVTDMSDSEIPINTTVIEQLNKTSGILKNIASLIKNPKKKTYFIETSNSLGVIANQMNFDELNLDDKSSKAKFAAGMTSLKKVLDSVKERLPKIQKSLSEAGKTAEAKEVETAATMCATYAHTIEASGKANAANKAASAGSNQSLEKDLD
jgi:hypothetical protein